MMRKKNRPDVNQGEVETKLSGSDFTSKRSRLKAFIVMAACRRFIPYAAGNYLIRVFRLEAA
jgi:hypothetical protein